MDLYTFQLPSTTTLTQSVDWVIDTTVKSGLHVFAPEWEWVMQSKAGTLPWSEYTRLYDAKMRDSYRTHYDVWLKVIQTPTVAIGCYCRAGHLQCHRHLLRDKLEKVALHHHYPYHYLGEYQKGSK